MSSGMDMTREERAELEKERAREDARQELARLKGWFEGLRGPGSAWVKDVSQRKERPTQGEWELWKALNALLTEIR
jgi:hypothetical protein